MDAFDPTDLRLRVQTGLSAPEMRRLLTNWGATAEEAAAKDASALAHYIVRVGAKQFGPAELIRRLSREKPLVEWPEVPDEPDSRWAGPMSIPGPTPAPPEVAAVLEQPLDAADTAVDAPPSSARGTEEPPASRAPASLATPSSKPKSSGLVFPEASSLRVEPARQGIDPRILIVAGGGMLLLVGLAFAAGLVWRSREPAAAAAASTQGPSVTEVPRSNGVAGRAANLVEARLLSVAGACGLTVNGEPTREVLELAQEACGRDEVERQRRARDRAARTSSQRGAVIDDDPSDPTATLPPDDRPPAKTAPEPRTLAADPKPPKPPAPNKPSCSTACARVRAECSEACGAEPGDAAQYDRYQACTGRCVTQETRCRQSCF